MTQLQHGPGLRDTWRALVARRRIAPIALVGLALLLTEVAATRSLAASFNLALFVVLFTLLVPATWRWSQTPTPSVPRFVVYGTLCATLVLVATRLMPNTLGFESYVLHSPAAAALFALSAIAGFVLGRDIELEEGLGDALERTEALSRATEDARLLALRQHLDPHFLFNTLGAIAEWCREDPLVAERALLGLSDMLRTLFDGIRTPLWPLRREVEVLHALHRLYALRDDERYVLEAEPSTPDDAPRATVPPLVLLPLFENAIKYGAAGAPMSLRVMAEADVVVVEIWNAGAFGGRREGGTGIETTERRLRLAFGDAASLRVGDSDRDGVTGTLARVTWPTDTKSADQPEARP